MLIVIVPDIQIKGCIRVELIYAQMKRGVLQGLVFLRNMSQVTTLEDVLQARQRIQDSVHYTPVYTSAYLNTIASHDLFFKCENLQRTGSFKV